MGFIGLGESVEHPNNITMKVKNDLLKLKRVIMGNVDLNIDADVVKMILIHRDL